MKSKIAMAIGAAIVLMALLVFSFSIGTAQQSKGKPGVGPVKRGEYLVNLAGCHDCHTPKIMTSMGPMPDSSRKLMGSPANEPLPPLPRDVVGMGPEKWGAVANQHFSAWYGPWGVSFTANLTPDKATGSGSWTEASFIKAMRTGKHLGAGRPILPPMPWQNLASLSDEDLRAIFSYLQSIPAIQNEVPMPIPPAGQQPPGSQPSGR